MSAQRRQLLWGFLPDLFAPIPSCTNIYICHGLTERSWSQIYIYIYICYKLHSIPKHKHITAAIVRIIFMCTFDLITYMNNPSHNDPLNTSTDIFLLWNVPFVNPSVQAISISYPYSKDSRIDIAIFLGPKLKSAIVWTFINKKYWQYEMARNKVIQK